MQEQFQIRFCTYFKRIEKFRYPCETYSDYTAFCLKEGSFSYTAGDVGGILAAPSAIICPPDVPFERSIVTPIELCMIKFTMTPTVTLPLKQPIIPTDCRRFTDNITHLNTCLFRSDFGTASRDAHFAADILYLLSEDSRNLTEFTEIHRYILAHFTEDLRVSALAVQTDYTEAHFINKFKSFYSLTPRAYISHLRLELAKELLLTTDLPIKEIAYRCGFSDELYFIRFFKSHTGITPGRFRKFSI